MVRRHRGQHPRRSIKQPAPDKVLDRVRDLRQLDRGRAGTWRRPKDFRDNELGGVADLAKLPFESTLLFTGLGQLLDIPTEARLGHLQVSLQCLHLFTQL